MSKKLKLARTKRSGLISKTDLIELESIGTTVYTTIGSVETGQECIGFFVVKATGEIRSIPRSSNYGYDIKSQVEKLMGL